MLYYSQSNHNWRKSTNDLDSYGLLQYSLENFTDLICWAPELVRTGREVLLSSEINNCLHEISGDRDDFCMWQNMFFDRATGTIDHIDTWYLDTDPMGHLIAAWVALEDIDGQGGEFHVYPGSHLSSTKEWKELEFEDFINWSEKERKKYNKKKILINKGDVLFWHPSLIHGSSNQRKEGFSRKSLTAHYHPISYKKGGGGASTNPFSKEYKDMVEKGLSKLRRFNSLPIYTYKRRRSIALSLIGLGKYFINMKNNEKKIMNRNQYQVEQFTK